MEAVTRFRAAVIDLDDTLVAFDAVSASSWKTVLDAYAEQHAVDAVTLYETIMRCNNWYWSDAERHRIGRNDLIAARTKVIRMAFDELHNNDDARALAEIYTRERTSQMFLYPGAHEMLDALHGLGMALVLVTNGEAAVQREKIERFCLARHFSHILIEGEKGYGKPDERIYNDALAVAGASPGATMIVGDNLEWEIAVPRRLGFFTVWCNHRGQKLPEDAAAKRPDAMIQSLNELVGVATGA
ncbi:MAG: HAD family hydrolase [Spirochaetes bacterium]|nr:HAD family hydrolase [Spirochaetota bacterium]